MVLIIYAYFVGLYNVYICAVYSVFRKCLTASNPTTMLGISILHHKNRYIGSINLKTANDKRGEGATKGAFLNFEH